MTDFAPSDAARSRPFARLASALAAQRRLVRDYATAVSGSAGRLVFSLAYFVLLANALSIAEFGIFATASAAGVMLSRILSFGFISALYRTATVRPRLIGAFAGGFLLLAALSIPVLVAASYAVWRGFFSGDVTLGVFALVIAAEALVFRPVEVIVIVNNGLGHFGRAALLVIIGTVSRAAAALGFAFLATRTLEVWALWYLGANIATLAIGLAFFLPRARLRLAPALYWRRLPDSLYVAGAELLFYLQMELDKLLVLAIGGPKLAGIYAIIMRLVDLTAIPIRVFTMMLVQKMMRVPGMLANLSRRVAIEAGIFAVSTLGLATLATLLWFRPTLLGANVAEAAPLVMLALLVPGLRNLLEYQAELLFARGQTGIRAINLALLGGLKAALLVLLFGRYAETADFVLAINALFVVLYAASALLTYSAMRRPPRAI